MNARQAIQCGLSMADTIVQGYLGDLTDAELLVRPVPGTNHIAWQLGHLIASEHEMMSEICPGTMPALPAGFQEKHTNDTCRLDSPGAFLSKSVYLEEMAKQRAGTLAALDKLTDADLDKPAPEKYASFVKTWGDLLSVQGSHWVMHAGQWAVIRRKLGRKPLF